MIPFTIKAIVSDEDVPNGEHTVYLFNKEQNLLLPIKLSERGASSLLLAKEGKQQPRPHIHDTATRLITSLNGKVEKIIVSGYENEIFYSYIRVKQGKTEFDIDSKPSDSFAIALRTNTPIHVQRDVVKRAGIKIIPEMLTPS